MKKLFFFLSCLAVIFSGCGYKLGSLTIGGIETISVTKVTNNTGKSYIEESVVANTLIEQFIADGSVKVVDSEIADAKIDVILINYNQKAKSFSSNDIGQDFRMIIDAKIIVTESSGSKPLYQGVIQGESLYGRDLDQTEIERVSFNEAIRDLCSEIVRKVVEGGW